VIFDAHNLTARHASLGHVSSRHSAVPLTGT
jgi:hypothetical protein